MTTNGILQILLYFAVLTLLVKPMGIYLVKVYNSEKTWLDFIAKPLERLIYLICRVDAKIEMNWKQYGAAMLIFSLVSTLAVYAIQRLQSFLPLNPQNLDSPSPELSFNTAVSFVSNTNWQAYSGEVVMSYFTQMTALSVQNFASAAVGMALAIVFIRGISRFETENLGNFWSDLVRGTLYILLPLSFLAAIFFVSQGVIQNFKPYETIQTIEGAQQTIAHGATASQLAIKMLGTNGGGFFNANDVARFLRDGEIHPRTRHSVADVPDEFVSDKLFSVLLRLQEFNPQPHTRTAVGAGRHLVGGTLGLGDGK